MSPRNKRIRKVLSVPIIKGFKPYGKELEGNVLEPVNVLFEEYEAIRLSDYKYLNHYQASELMGVSRPTFTRIYASALKKIAKAFVEGRQIAIDGGKVYFDSNWFNCKKCTCYFNNPDMEKDIRNCPLCGSLQIQEYDYENNCKDSFSDSLDVLCICPFCGYEEEHLHGIPCNNKLCPNCNIALRKSSNPDCK
jgi:predicted DNA-binding protein (UPF0251 family)